MPSEIPDGISYSLPIGLIYAFNLIVGTGALALPKALQSAGYVLGSAVLALSCFVSYLGITFVMESMSVVNALHLQRRKHSQSQMADIVLGRLGFVLFQLCLIIYLYGDLAVYTTVVPKSLMNVVCTFRGANRTCMNESTITEDMACFSFSTLSRMNMYRVFAIAFVCFMGPFVFIGLNKTKYLQIFTTAARWLAFGFLLVLGSMMLAGGKGTGHPPMVNLSGFGSVFGVSCYAFICHHSLPSLVTPIKNKRRIHGLFVVVYVLILVFYATLALTGSFAFATLEDIYTLNFLPDPCKTSGGGRGVVLLIVDYFLSLYPVMALTTNFPIVGVTLRNNLRALLPASYASIPSTLPHIQSNGAANGVAGNEESGADTEVLIGEDVPGVCAMLTSNEMKYYLYQYLIPLGVILPPVLVSCATQNVETLSSITGSYGGVLVQFVLPSVLVLFARRRCVEVLATPVPPSKATPLLGSFWPILLLIWAVIAIVIVTINFIIA